MEVRGMFCFLGTFVKLHKVAHRFIMSVHPHGATQPPLDGFTGNLIYEYFLKICRDNACVIKI
jgi:hypothetical protein